MYVSDHPDIPDQPDATAKVWRYMDLGKYISMLDAKALHFARADRMADPWEGAVGEAYLKAGPEMYGEFWKHMKPRLAQNVAHFREHVHLNCWHMSEVESAAMWSIYQRDGSGVAVQTSWGELTRGITSSRDVFGSRVTYIDYSRAFVRDHNFFFKFLVKRESFAHEKEVRLFMGTETEDGDPEPAILPVEVDLPTIVSRVYVAPEAQPWIRDVVEGVTRAYGFDFSVIQSDLLVGPVY